MRPAARLSQARKGPSADNFLGAAVSEIRELLDQSRRRVAVQVNQELLSTCWQIREIIVRYEQNEQVRAAYGESTLRQLFRMLTRELGKGFSVSNIQSKLFSQALRTQFNGFQQFQEADYESWRKFLSYACNYAYSSYFVFVKCSSIITCSTIFG